VPRFMFKASYTIEGLRGIQSQGGTARREAVAKVTESVGGRLEGFYFALGEDDVFVIAELPDLETATAMALAVNASGAVSSKTVVLLTPEEVDAAAKRSVDYTPPGG
jgi:uncharacterized protein with GYD domain